MPRNKPKVALPIRKYKEKIIKSLSENRVIIVIGHTGCGKSTQLPQMLHEEGYADQGVIACTQPRRFAAYSLAKRVSTEMKCKLGDKVGYRYRFENQSNRRQTRVLYMTDGSLLMEQIHDSKLSRYSVVMLDEVHERALQTDLLFGLLKKTLAERKDLKVIVTSATMEADTFSRYFFGAPVIEVEGSMHPVDIVYRPVSDGDNMSIAQEITRLDREETEGDVLVFLSGKQEIDEVAKGLSKEKHLHVIPAHAELSTADLDLIHQDAPEGKRKVVLATNVAETSLTVEGIVFVVDQGFVKMGFYNADINANELKRIRCSQAEAQQRKGRAGRTRPGKCYRLYSEHTFENEMPKLRRPEVTRANLTAMTLQLKSIGYDDVLLFDFLTRPDIKNLKCALDQLHQLEALDDDCSLTRRGRLMVGFPLDPPLASCLVQSTEEGCSEELLIICAVISALNDSNLKKISRNMQSNSPVMSEFKSSDGEPFALLEIFREYRSKLFSKTFIEEYELNGLVMNDARQIYWQLTDLMKRYVMPICSCGDEKEPIIRSLVAGLFQYITVDDETGITRSLKDNKTVKIRSTYLNEDAEESEKFIGISFAKPSEWMKRILQCVTPLPPELDLTKYRERLELSCSHFGKSAGEEREPFWLTEVKDIYDKYIKKKEKVKKLKDQLESEQTKLAEMDTTYQELREEMSLLRTNSESQQSSLSEAQSACRRLRAEKAKLQAQYETERRNLLEANSTCDRLRKENTTLQTQYETERASAVQWRRKSSERQEKNKSLDVRLENEKARLADLESRCQQLQNEKAHLESKLRGLQEVQLTDLHTMYLKEQSQNNSLRNLLQDEREKLALTEARCRKLVNENRGLEATIERNRSSGFSLRRLFRR